MTIDPFALQGRFVCLEPLERGHAEALVAATGQDRELYARTFVPFDIPSAQAYIDHALSLRAAGTGIAFAVRRLSDNAIIGSTRFWRIERWAWPTGSIYERGQSYDTCEIGFTWLAPEAIRTAINSEQKLLMLTHAFEVWKCLSVQFETDVRNTRSATAITRLGAKLEGTLRAHRMGADFTPRNSLRFSIIAEEWPEIKRRLEQRLESANG